MNGTKQNPMRPNAFHAVLIAIVIGAATLGHAEMDGRHAWTTSGAVGIADSKDAHEVEMRIGQARFASDAPAGASAIIRYNVAATSALVGTLSDSESLQLKVAYMKSDPDDQVEVFLRQLPLDASQRKTTLLSFDSDDEGRSAGTRTASSAASGIELDFQNNSYCLLVVLSKSGKSSGPAFKGASIAPTGE